MRNKKIYVYFLNFQINKTLHTKFNQKKRVESGGILKWSLLKLVPAPPLGLLPKVLVVPHGVPSQSASFMSSLLFTRFS